MTATQKQIAASNSDALARSFITQVRLLMGSRWVEPVAEYRFAREVVGNDAGVRKRLSEAGLRDWAFDFAWPELKLAVEIEGGIWSGGRHTRGKGFDEDCRKYNSAVKLGWRVYRFTRVSIDDERSAASWFADVLYTAHRQSLSVVAKRLGSGLGCTPAPAHSFE